MCAVNLQEGKRTYFPNPLTSDNFLHCILNESNHSYLPLIFPSLQLSIHHPSIHHLPIYSSIYPSLLPSIINPHLQHPPLHQISIHSSIHPSFHPSSIHSCILPSIHLECPLCAKHCVTSWESISKHICGVSILVGEINIKQTNKL